MSSRYDLIPAHFAQTVVDYEPEGFESGDAWIRRLPRLVDELLDDWELTPVDSPLHGTCSLVLPVRLGGSSRDLAGVSGEGVLKIVWPHRDAETEHLALSTWAGTGSVRLLRADPARWALLLERAHPRSLVPEPIDSACEVLGDLLRRLRATAHPRVARLADRAHEIADQLEAAEDVIPRRYLDQAASLARELVTDGPDDLLHTDLHYENVLRAYRAPWLAIDPKPLAGDRAYEVAPALWNRADELTDGGVTPRAHLRWRVSLVCERAGIDEERARAWAIVREAANALAEARRWEGPDPARIGLAVTIIKAMND